MAVAMYLKVEGVDGENTTQGHEQWIEVIRYKHGLKQPVSGVSATGGRTGGRADFEKLEIVKTIDQATPDLNLKCAKGEPIPKVELEICQAAGEKHTCMKYTIEDCIVASVEPGGSKSDEVKPLETVSFSYGKITWAYTPVDHQGNKGATTERVWSLEEDAQA